MAITIDLGAGYPNVSLVVYLKHDVPMSYSITIFKYLILIIIIFIGSETS